MASRDHSAHGERPDIQEQLARALDENAALRSQLAAMAGAQDAIEQQVALQGMLLDAIAEHCPLNIYAKDCDSRFIFANEAVARLIGVSPAQLLGRTDFEFFSESLARQYYDDEQALVASGAALIAKDEPCITPDGEDAWLLTTKFALRDAAGNIIGLLGIGQDITERKLMEQALRQRHAELLALNQDLIQTQEKLIETKRLAALGSLVAGVAHELNTPLGNCLLVLGTLEELSSELVASMTAGLTRNQLTLMLRRFEEGVLILGRNLYRAAELVTSFKQVAVDQTSSQRRTFDLKDVVDEIILAVKPLLRKVNAQVRIDVTPHLKMDSYPGPLGQILINLIDNAIKHGLDGQADGHIAITARADMGMLVLTVTDSGGGIGEADLAHIFEPFYTTKLGMGGTGLGLHVVHNIVTGLLGGTIEVVSTPGQGARFTLTLPMCTPAHPPSI